MRVDFLPPYVKDYQYTMAFGIEGMEPLKGTVQELMNILDGYDIFLVQRLYFAECALKTELAEWLRPYVADRFVIHFAGPEE